MSIAQECKVIKFVFFKKKLIFPENFSNLYRVLGQEGRNFVPETKETEQLWIGKVKLLS